MKVILILQCRYNSSRLPGKILLKYKGQSLLSIMLKRLKKLKNIDKIVVAIGKDKNYSKIVRECKINKVDFYLGSELDVIDRFYKISKKFSAENIIRITSDCPLVDLKLADKMTSIHISKKYDYTSNNFPPTFPHGFDIEIFKFKALKKAWKKSRKHKFLREHVTTYIRSNKSYFKKNIKNKKDLSFIRLTIDYLEDYKLIKLLLNKIKDIYDFDVKSLENIYKKNKEMFTINSMYSRK